MLASSDNANLVTLHEIRAAQKRLRGIAVHTRLLELDAASLAAAGIRLPYRVHVKLENEQPIGSFKLRGAYNKIAQLPAEALTRGVIAYSSGNHAQGVAFAVRALGGKATIVMPRSVPAVKRDAVAALGAEIILVGTSSNERMERVHQLAAEHGYTIIPPYDDPQIIAGAGTCGLEIMGDLPDVDYVLTPVGGGGLISGVATAVKGLDPDKKIFGVEPELAADATASFAAKQIVAWTDEQISQTLADGLRTQAVGVLNFEHILRIVDGILTVTEDEIRAAMSVMAKVAGFMPEPSGAVALAAALYRPASLPGAQNIAVVITGGNVDPTLRDDILRG
jgi:threo-3-hydroxy-L-aspartate ammonia-lyase